MEATIEDENEFRCCCPWTTIILRTILITGCLKLITTHPKRTLLIGSKGLLFFKHIILTILIKWLNWNLVAEFDRCVCGHFLVPSFISLAYTIKIILHSEVCYVRGGWVSFVGVFRFVSWLSDRRNCHARFRFASRRLSRDRRKENGRKWLWAASHRDREIRAKSETGAAESPAIWWVTVQAASQRKRTVKRAPRKSWFFFMPSVSGKRDGRLLGDTRIN